MNRLVLIEKWMNFKVKTFFSVPPVDYFKLKIKWYTQSAVVTVDLIVEKNSVHWYFFDEKKGFSASHIIFFSWNRNSNWHGLIYFLDMVYPLTEEKQHQQTF